MDNSSTELQRVPARRHTVDTEGGGQAGSHFLDSHDLSACPHIMDQDGPAVHATPASATAGQRHSLLDAAPAPAPSPAYSFHHESRIAAARGRNVAMSMWLGVTLDGIPEALMLGFMTNDGTLSWVLIVSVFIANFPEAFSAASILKGHGVRPVKILLMWSSVFVNTGVLAMVGSLILPNDVAPNSVIAKEKSVLTASMEGLTGGAMMAMTSTAMLPHAFHGAGQISGLFFVSGFLLSVILNGIGTHLGPPPDLSEL